MAVQLFVPGVAQQPNQTPKATGPNVQPFENHGPDNLINLGNVVEQAGSQVARTAETIGDRIQDRINGTAVRNAETQMLTSSMQVLHDPNTGYLHTTGKAALDNYDATADALLKARKDAEGTLQNKTQLQMFGAMADQHMVGFDQQIGDHRFSQVSAMDAESRKARVSALTDAAVYARGAWDQFDEQGPIGKFHQNINAIVDESNGAANALYGVGPKDAIALAMKQDALTKVASGVVRGFLDIDKNSAAAKAFFKAWQANRMIDPDTADQLNREIEQASNKDEILDGANVLNKYANSDGRAAKGIADSGMPNFQGLPVVGSSFTIGQGLGADRSGQAAKFGGSSSHNGIDIQVSENTPVVAPADGKVTEVYTTPRGGLQVVVNHGGSWTTGYAHLNTSNVRVGDEVKAGQVIAATGKTGDATGPVLHYTMTNAAGVHVDPRQYIQADSALRSLHDKNTQSISDPNVLQSAIDEVNNSDLEPEVKKDKINYMRALSSQQRQIETEQQRNIDQQGMDIYYQNNANWTSIPAQVYSKMSPELQYKLKQPGEQKNDPDVYFRLATDPNLTMEKVQAARPYLETGTWVSLGREAMVRQKQNEGLMDASIDMAQINRSLALNGMSQYIDPKKGSPEQIAAANLYMGIQDSIRAQQITLKRPLNDEEKQREIDKAILSTVQIWNWGGGSANVPMFSLTTKNDAKAFTRYNGRDVAFTPIPDDIRGLLAQDMAAQGKPTDPASIYAEWVARGKPQVANMRGTSYTTNPDWWHRFFGVPVGRAYEWDVNNGRTLKEWSDALDRWDK